MAFDFRFGRPNFSLIAINYHDTQPLPSSIYSENESAHSLCDIAGICPERKRSDNDSRVPEAANGRCSCEEANDDEEEALEQEREEIEVINAGSNPTEGVLDPGCPAVTSIPASSGMNLAAALAAERQFREASIIVPSTNNVEAITAAGTPLRVSLMRLLEEADGGDGEVGAENEKGAVGSDTVCCVCMARKKGAAFIPCGHTYCRCVRGSYG
ncbi:hypothetical protein GH714_000378 [Hevea brasiliensis]|uniref:RING-type domain-containing protein n=1 Tax=Hevea brasiliensis TaxID=3981 RepID=A0A6A6LU03_HEVBR|nr:hypothetical protein GH714_000378 [Hevea brasiliensis]